MIHPRAIKDEERTPSDSFVELRAEIVGCFRCPRLVAHREQIGVLQRRAYRGQNYWSKPVPGFGDPAARLLLVGLAPGAHGANRTGRMFTGDRSGEFLYRALWETGFANQPGSLSSDDGLTLKDAYIAAALRCVPPDNKPAREEILACRSFLLRELSLLKNLQLVVALGGIALQAYLSILQDKGQITSRTAFQFGHGRTYQVDGSPRILACYHPSQQNTSTRKLTAEMLRDVFLQARALVSEGSELSEAPETV